MGKKFVHPIKVRPRPGGGKSDPRSKGHKLRMESVARAVAKATEHRAKPTPVRVSKKSPVRCEASKQRMRERGVRSSRYNHHGEDSYQAKLTVAKVLYILRSDATHAALAKEFDVSPSTIGYIRLGKMWARVFIAEQRRKQCQPPQ